MTRFVPKSTRPVSRLAKNVGLTLRAPPARAETPEQVEGVAPCAPNITGLVWIAPFTAEETDTAVLEFQQVETDYDVGGPSIPVLHNVPNSNKFWEARIKGTLCCDCEVVWDVEWIGDDDPPGYRFRWDWGVLIPGAERSGTQIDQGAGVLTVSATVTCPAGIFNVGPITAVVTAEGGGGS